MEISLVDAARMIFRTRTPNDQQIHRVYQVMKTGALKVRDYGGPPLKWTTTEQALAEFLAAGRVNKALAQPMTHVTAKLTKENLDEPPARVSALHGQESAKLRDVYRGIWTDYFMAVMLRRRMAHRSVTFNRAVVAGQVLLLLAIVSVIVGGTRMMVVATPPEHVAIEKWLQENTDDYSIDQWHPTEPATAGGSIVRVQYRYQKESRRWIHTDRTFNVIGDDVTEHASAD